MAKLWPRLEHIRFAFNIMDDADYEVWGLSDLAFRILRRLVGRCAVNLVWTYSEPGDGSFPDDDEDIAAHARITGNAWLSVRKEIEPFFRIENGRWHLARDWIELAEAGARSAIPKDIQRVVASRQGEVCAYCGDTDGPFEYDHIFPVSRGGSDKASNLTLACEACNRSKGGRTLVEWIEYLAGKRGGQ